MIPFPYQVGQLGLGQTAAGGGGGGYTYATWNPADKNADIGLSDADLKAFKSTGTDWRSGRATLSKSAGKWYFECYLAAEACIGLMTSGHALGTYVGNSSNGAGFAAHSASYLQSGITLANSGGIAAGDGTYGIAWDEDAGKAWLNKAGTWAGSGNPAAGTNPTWTFTAGMVLFPCCSIYTTPSSSRYALANFGASALSHTPSGFNAGVYV